MEKLRTIGSAIAGIVCGCAIVALCLAIYTYRINMGSGYWYRAVAASPNDARQFVMLGFSLEDENNYAEAQQAFERAHALNSRMCTATMELGNLAEHRGDHAQARKYWQQIADQTSGAKTNLGRMWHARASTILAGNVP